VMLRVVARRAAVGMRLSPSARERGTLADVSTGKPDLFPGRTARRGR
jgi:hypothetical protein